MKIFSDTTKNNQDNYLNGDSLNIQIENGLIEINDPDRKDNENQLVLSVDQVKMALNHYIDKGDMDAAQKIFNVFLTIDPEGSKAYSEIFNSDASDSIDGHKATSHRT